MDIDTNQDTAERAATAREVQTDSKLRALKQYSYHAYMDYFAANEDVLYSYVIDREIIPFMKGYVKARNRGMRYPYMLVSVNPRPNVEYQAFDKKIKKFLRKKFIERFMYCIEWTSEEVEDDVVFHNGNMHMHCKIWLNKHKKPSEVRRETHSTFKHLCDLSGVDIKGGTVDGCFEPYVNGLKKGQPKDCTIFNNKYRSKYMIPDVYHV